MSLERNPWIVAILFFASAQGCSKDSTPVSSPRYSARSDSAFAVGDSSVLEISNFAGTVTVTPGNSGSVQVLVERWAGRPEDLDAIEVEMVELQNGVRVRTGNPLGLSNVSVDMAAMVPADTRPSIEGAAGEIDYKGRGQGECSFGIAAGAITLRLPADVNVEVHLTIGTGTIGVDFPVVGQVTDHLVDGIIGTGTDGKIAAQVGSGEIHLVRQ